MSTTTNFKRVALVAVAALGLGVLSSVPSQAVINSDSLTLSSATASQTTAETFTATSAVATVSFFGAAQDSLTITAALVSTTAVGNTSLPVLRLIETSSAIIDTLVALAGGGASTFAGSSAGTPTLANAATRVAAASSSVTTIAKYAVYLATSAGSTAAPTTAGTYVVRLTPAAIGVGPLVGATAQNLTITVTSAAALDKTPAAATSSSRMYEGEAAANLFTLATADSVVSTVRTIGADAVATISVTLKNAANTTSAVDSITATITGPGSLGSIAAGSIASVASQGRSITVKQGDLIGVFADGVAGIATITLTSLTAGVALGTAKTVTFTSTTATSYAAPTIAATDSSVILSGTGTTVSVFAKDGTNNVSGLTTASAAGGTTIWAYSSDTAVATVAAVGSFVALTGYSVVVTGVAAGIANISFGNAATRAAATIVSPTVAVRVGTAVPSNVTVTTDKATYAPGEKITMTVTILNAAGLPVVGATTYASIFSSTGVTPSVNLSSGTLPAAAIADYSNTANTKTFTLYAPIVGGPVVFSYTGGTGLATANQVARTVSVTVTDSSAAALAQATAALAAVTALATTVASLRTLIVTLTNLVLKIQKKVKA